jgi:hypothetical protein
MVIPLPKQGALLRFLIERQPHSKATLDVIKPKLIEGGVNNECLRNASLLEKKYGFRMVSGWLYIAKPDIGSAQFTQHWWNYDSAEKVFYDLSPNIEVNAIHVLDLGLAQFASEQFGYLTVAKSILLRGNQFFSLDYGNQGFDIEPISRLDDQTLFPPRPHHGTRIT